MKEDYFVAAFNILGLLISACFESLECHSQLWSLAGSKGRESDPRRSICNIIICHWLFWLGIYFLFIEFKVGVPVSAAHQMDVYQENEELKEELSKLAAKVGSKILFNILITSLSKKF